MQKNVQPDLRKNRTSMVSGAGTRLTWKEMVEKFPDKWVFVKNAELHGATIVSGEVMCVCNDEEYSDKMIELRHNGVEFQKGRTTHDSFGGIIHAENAKIELK